MAPIYDPSKSYFENATDGPFFSGEIPEPGFRQQGEAIDFLGTKIGSPIGVPAGPLLNARWIAFAAKMGFDVLTYKTIRSFAYPGHPLPNVLFVDKEGTKAREVKDPDFNRVSITNSFGMPSRSPEFLMQDIEVANRSLSSGQVMIVSVVGTPGRKTSFLDDFVDAALLAKEAGAKIIEANFSCPNVDPKEGSLYLSAETVYAFAKKISDAIYPIPLLIKVGLFSNFAQMQAVFEAAAKAGCAGIAGLNSISMEVCNAKGEPALGPERKTSGICGNMIRDAALEFMRLAAKIRKDKKLDLVFIGSGGLMLPEHFNQMLDAGADIAATATGMMWDPFLAMKYHAMVQTQQELCRC